MIEPIYLKKMYNYLSIDSKLDFIFRGIDEMVMKGDFETVDEILSNLDVNYMDVDEIVGFLTITCMEKDNLKERNGFFIKSKTRLSEKYKLEEIDKILGGLE